MSMKWLLFLKYFFLISQFKILKKKQPLGAQKILWRSNISIRFLQLSSEIALPRSLKYFEIFQLPHWPSSAISSDSVVFAMASNTLKIVPFSTQCTHNYSYHVLIWPFYFNTCPHLLNRGILIRHLYQISQIQNWGFCII